MSTTNTPKKLGSFACGDWVTGNQDGVLLLDASTFKPIASVDSSGLNVEAMLHYARQKGRSALQAMTFHQRALMLKALGQALLADKESFYPMSYATGATRTDSWIDIEGGISTLLTYGSKGRRELPNERFIIDGNVEPLARDNTFSGQHFYTSLQGVAIHINAYNFPIWGMLEKLAPTLLAGMPAIIKPASQTAYLTHLMVQKILATGILPPGALQLICGSVGNLLDYVESQDVVTFTGSASTGQRLKSHSRIVSQSTRFTMEADSLNAAILGTDVTSDSVEFELFVNEVVREMTVKAGQKCTAIRRVIVPESLMQAVEQAISQRLESITVGDPRDKATNMGPVASLEHLNDLSLQLQKLKRETQCISGRIEQVEALVNQSTTGAYMQPLLLRCDNPLEARAVHDTEAFGPVATLMPYASSSDAIALAAKGGGSLVASLFTNDPNVAADVTHGLAPWHGRVMIGNRVSAKSSTGHGSPLPMLVHGGPGRAGGGEELGGIRAVKHYMQRSAVQGPPDLLSAVAGQWVSGARTNDDDLHPFRKNLQQLSIGDSVKTASRRISLEDIEHFANFTGDTFYAHMDEDAAKANPFFDGRVAHGYLVVSLAAGLFVEPSPGPVLANYGVDSLRFLTPVYPDDELSVTLICKAITPREQESYGEVRWDCTVCNQDAAVVAQYDVLTLVAKD